MGFASSRALLMAQSSKTVSRTKHELATGTYYPHSPGAWLLRGKLTQVSNKIYVNKPPKYNAELFDLIPLHEVYKNE